MVSASARMPSAARNLSSQAPLGDLDPYGIARDIDGK